jgi:ribosome-binding protein aMBF1 (putative translation factor)
MTDRLPKVAPSAQLTRLEDALRDLNQQVKAARSREAERRALVGFLQRHKLLTRKDVIEASKTIAPRRGLEPVESDTKRGPVGKAIYSARKAKGLSAEALGKKIGRHQATIRFWEKGKGQVPSTLRPKLAKVLGLPVGALVNGHAAHAPG